MAESALIKTILGREMMEEFAVDQEILQEGEQGGFFQGEQRGFRKGKLGGKFEVAEKLLERGLSVAEVIRLTSLSADASKNILIARD